MQAQQEVHGFMGSVLVVKGDEVLLSKGYGKANLEHDIDNTPDTKFRIGSISKQFTAAAILKLQEQGLLDVSDSISKHLPDYPKGNDITIHHLLTHSAGIPSFTGFEDYQIFKKQHHTLEEIINRFKDSPLEFAPGTKYNYSNSGYILLAHLTEKVSGKSYGEFLEQEFFKPHGLTNTGEERLEAILPNKASGYGYTGEYWNCDFIDMTVPTGGGSLYSTTHDLYQWSRKLQTGNIIKKNLFEHMRSPLIAVDETNKAFYGYGLANTEWESEQVVWHDGGIEGFVSSSSHYTPSQLSIIVLCNVETCDMTSIRRALRDICFGKDVKLPEKLVAIDVDSSILSRYIGNYELEPKFILSIRLDNGRLMGQATGQDEFELFASSETEFFTYFNAGATFVVEEGKPSSLVWHQGGGHTNARRLES
jgi:CubicO group peptidase (beta-lactamase class C family)